MFQITSQEKLTSLFAEIADLRQTCKEWESILRRQRCSDGGSECDRCENGKVYNRLQSNLQTKEQALRTMEQEVEQEAKDNQRAAELCHLVPLYKNLAVFFKDNPYYQTQIQLLTSELNALHRKYKVVADPSSGTNLQISFCAPQMLELK
jgi:hypothetical protein